MMMMAMTMIIINDGGNNDDNYDYGDEDDDDDNDDDDGGGGGGGGNNDFFCFVFALMILMTMRVIACAFQPSRRRPSREVCTTSPLTWCSWTRAVRGSNPWRNTSVTT